MANSNSLKQERRNQLDPKSQGLVSSVPQLPGGPPNNPMNDNTIFSEPPTTMDPSGMSQTPNGQYINPQFPVQINGPSGQPQFIVNGQGNNSIFAYNNQMQPPVFDEQGQAQLLAGHLGQKAWELGLDADAPGSISPMGPVGRTAMPAPGAFPSEMNANRGTLPLQGGAIAQGGGGGRPTPRAGGSGGKGTGRGAQNGGPRTA